MGKYYSALAEPHADADSQSYACGVAVGNSGATRPFTDFNLRVSDRDPLAVAEAVSRRFVNRRSLTD